LKRTKRNLVKAMLETTRKQTSYEEEERLGDLS
jgi:hypothetical protein